MADDLICVEVPRLSIKHTAFVDEFLRTFNATMAYKRVYPKTSSHAARANASRLIAKDSISSAIRARLSEMHMSADEVLKLLADMARGDMGDFIDASGVGFSLDMKAAKEKGITKLIKKVKQKTTTFIAKKESEEDREVHELEIELYDAQSALEKIGKHHRLFTDSVDLTTGGKPLSDVIGVKLIDYRTGITETAPRPGGDSEPPRQDENSGDGPPLG